MKWKAPNNAANVLFDCKLCSRAAEFELHWSIVRRRSLHDPIVEEFIIGTLFGAIHFTIALDIPRDSGKSFCTALWIF